MVHAKFRPQASDLFTDTLWPGIAGKSPGQMARFFHGDRQLSAADGIMSDLIARYTDEVRRSLAFDRESAERLAAEIEDHLYESLAEASGPPGDEQVRAAIRRFGSSRTVIATYITQIFPQRLGAAWQTGLVLGALILVVMWLRRELGLLPLVEGQPGTETLLIVDAIGFRAAVMAGLFAWGLSAVDQARRYASLLIPLLLAAAGALTLSIAASIILSSTAVIASGWSSSSLVGLTSALIAGALMLFLAGRVRTVIGYVGLITRLNRQPHDIEAL